MTRPICFFQRFVPCLRTVATAWHTSETGVTTAVMAHVNSLRTAVAEETRTTSAPGRSVRGSVAEMVCFFDF